MPDDTRKRQILQLSSLLSQVGSGFSPPGGPVRRIAQANVAFNQSQQIAERQRIAKKKAEKEIRADTAGDIGAVVGAVLAAIFVPVIGAPAAVGVIAGVAAASGQAAGTELGEGDANLEDAATAGVIAGITAGAGSAVAAGGASLGETAGRELGKAAVGTALRIAPQLLGGEKARKAQNLPITQGPGGTGFIRIGRQRLGLGQRRTDPRSRLSGIVSPRDILRGPFQPIQVSGPDPADPLRTIKNIAKGDPLGSRKQRFEKIKSLFGG